MIKEEVSTVHHLVIPKHAPSDFPQRLNLGKHNERIVRNGEGLVGADIADIADWLIR